MTVSSRIFHSSSDAAKEASVFLAILGFLRWKNLPHFQAFIRKTSWVVVLRMLMDIAVTASLTLALSTCMFTLFICFSFFSFLKFLSSLYKKISYIYFKSICAKTNLLSSHWPSSKQASLLLRGALIEHVCAWPKIIVQYPKREGTTSSPSAAWLGEKCDLI